MQPSVKRAGSDGEVRHGVVSKLLVTIGIIFYAVAVPVLEINATHVFNPSWTPHARLHEVWQLLTNTTIGAFCFWQIWFRQNIRLASLMTLFVAGGFLVAYVLRGTYGGSMVLSDGTEKVIFGINLGVFAFSLAIILAGLAVLLNKAESASGMASSRMP